MIRRLWQWSRRPGSRFAWSTIFIAGGIAGIVFWGSFNTFMEYTNTLGFCISCHEMRDTPFAEYRKTVHYRNAAGVRVICSDCHVPRQWTAKLVRKIRDSSEILHKIRGTIGTPEKFEVRRLEMAERVWATMKASDSRECRNCHSFEAMDFHKQGRRAREKMQAGLKEGKTCIDCHKGIAHKLPAGPDGDDDD
jgi:nitrate/TMAO reductase-like tetraheme cytochrome c subunit